MACCRTSAQAFSPANSLPADAGALVQAAGQTNTARVTRRDGLKYLEEELTRSLQFLSGKRSLDGVVAPSPFQAPPPQTTIITVRSKEDSDSSKGWGALDSNDPADREKSLDLIKTPGKNRSDARRNSLDELYRKMNQERLGPDNAASKGFDPLHGQYSQRDQESLDSQNSADLPNSVHEKARGLRKGLSSERSERIYNPGGGDEGGLFGPFETKDAGLSREDIQSHQDYLQRYRQVLAGSSPTPGLKEPFKTAPTASTPQQAPGYGGLDPYASSGRLTGAVPPPSPGSVFNPTTLPDVNSKVANQWNPLYQAPRVEPYKPPRLQSPPFAEAPRRRF